MFECDDFDQVLSQLDFPDVPSKKPVTTAEGTSKSTVELNNAVYKRTDTLRDNSDTLKGKVAMIIVGNGSPKQNKISPEANNFVSPKHTKRKILNTLFDHHSKRKFPGPAGLLTGSLEGSENDEICQVELLSQDIDFTQNHLQKDLFESPLWKRLLDETKSSNLCDIDSIKTIKIQAASGNLQKRKAKTVIAFVETIDRSTTDPLIILKDSTGHIKGTLHRDAWSAFAQHISAEYCALVLRKPTVLTTGSAFKKHYLNITLSNIFAIFSSADIKDEDISLPDGYERICEDNITIIKCTKEPDPINVKEINDTHNLFEGLENIFSDDIF